MKYTSDFSGLPGPARIWAMFDPAHKISLAQAGGPLQLTYNRLYKRIKEGTIGLVVRKDEQGRMFINVADLVDYLYPPDAPSSPAEPPRPGPKKKKQNVTAGSV